MPVIELSTHIAAPRKRVFDLARSVDAHVASSTATGERAVAGVTGGLLELHDEVTWQARHLGVMQELTSRITAFERPAHFQDTMQQGAFSSLQHDHWFDVVTGGTVMRDRLAFTAPFGPLGRLAERGFLTGYLRRFLEERNRALKTMAESPAGSAYLATEYG